MNEPSNRDVRRADAVVVGGGLAGLTAAALLARAGRSVVVFEKAREAGGRAITTGSSGFRMNLGPHATYNAGPGLGILRDLGLEPSGGTPGASGAFALSGERVFPFPATAFGLVTSRMLPLGAKLEAARALAKLSRVDPSSLGSASVATWLAHVASTSVVRDLVGSLVRVSTYSADFERLSAGAALSQVQLALSKGVRYLDGGWQTLVDGLGEVAGRYGARIVTSERVVAVEHDGVVRGVRLADGRTIEASAIVLATGPSEAADLARRTDIEAWAEAAIPVRAACLDIALDRLPVPDATFALGLDRPLYLSVHTAHAKLAPAGGAVVHAMRYLGGAGDGTSREVEDELEQLVGTLQPGWRERVVARRFLPAITVSNALVTAAGGGLAGRPGPAVPGVAGLFVAGDWVGGEGMLLDAVLSSARRAAHAITAHGVDAPEAIRVSSSERVAEVHAV